MRVYVFREKGARVRPAHRELSVRAALHAVATGTDTADLVVALYLLKGPSLPGGHYVAAWRTPADFADERGKWGLVRYFRQPADLPTRFRLIRMAFGTSFRYPKDSLFGDGWHLTCAGFQDDLAALFAHELHHYRRYHLGLHPGEGEASAWKWALNRVTDAGFRVKGVRRKRSAKSGRSRRRRPLADPAAGMTEDEVVRHHARLRALPDGAALRIVRDGGRRGLRGQTVVKLRTPRSDAYRMPIRMPDGHEWYWPMTWLEPCPPPM